ncbi:MAG: TIGR01212 family radical SAM protein [Deltaproteobacteria bacterium]|nr:TIGR01212 family radical SAM protein [Deltaproteobacteria bacterium]
MKRYASLSGWMKNRYGCRVFKVSLSAATTCPNLDGTLARGGCSFCNDASYAPNSTRNRVFKPIPVQLEEGIEYIRKRHRTSKFISYFQSFTSTYGAMETLLPKFMESLEHPDVVGFALSTRPDCIDEKWARTLSELAPGKLCWIEMGLQTSSDQTLSRINRWHTRWQFGEALQKWRDNCDIPVCAHVVLGLPGETRQHILETAKYLATQPIEGVKIHNLHVVKGTMLAKTWQEGDYTPLTLEEFVSQTVDFLEFMPPHILIHRLNAHAPRALTLAPEWSVNKLSIFNAVENELKRRDSWQGKALGFNALDA